MYFEFFYSVAPICLAVGIPFLFLLIGTAVYNSLIIKRDRALSILSEFNHVIFDMLLEVTRITKGITPSLPVADAKELDLRRNALKRAIELRAPDKIDVAESRLFSYLEECLNDKAQGDSVLLAKTVETYKETVEPYKAKYNKACLVFNKSLKKAGCFPVVNLMKIEPLHLL
ncbi:hypothetical protein ACI2KR_08340 [Pseudomonas luteola]